MQKYEKEFFKTSNHCVFNQIKSDDNLSLKINNNEASDLTQKLT